MSLHKSKRHGFAEGDIVEVGGWVGGHKGRVACDWPTSTLLKVQMIEGPNSQGVPLIVNVAECKKVIDNT